MISVGVRELRQRASELLRRVERGEVIEITDRGRPVAQLGPLPVGSPLEQLRAAGDIEPASENASEFPDPVSLPEDMDLPSTVLAGLRHNER
jgi:prevent-host-death family protein